MPLPPLLPVDEIITHIYGGPLEPKPWQSFLHCLRLRTDCDVAAITLRPAKASLKSITLWDRRHPISELQIASVAQDHARLAHLDPLANALRKSGDIFTLDEVISREQLQHNEFYLQVLKPYGTEHLLGMYFSEPGGWKCHVGIMNGAERPNFGAAEKEFFVAFRAHLERALHLYASLKRHEMEKEIYGEALDRLTIGAIILNGQGKILETNKFARHILARSPYISLAGGTIALSKAKFRDDFARMLQEALASRERPEDGPFVDALRIDTSAGPHLGLLIRAVSSTEWFQSDASPSVIIYLSDLEQQPLAPEQVVAQLFGLTQSEALLATLLANGCTLAEAAVRLKLTESSVRTYSKTIYSKTGVNRQAELVRLILKSVATLAAEAPPTPAPTSTRAPEPEARRP